jgi:hypothetical protein
MPETLASRSQARIPRLDDLAAAWQPVADFMCMPSVNSCRGAVKVDRDLLSVSHVAIPPITLGGEQTDEDWWEYPERERPGDPVPNSLRDHVRMSGIADQWGTAGSTARMRVDGRRHRAQEIRWFPHQVQRRGVADSLEVLTTVRMPDDQPGVLLELALRNPGPAERTVRVDIELSGAVRRYDSGWSFWIPRPAVADDWDTACDPDCRSVTVTDRRSPARAAFSFAGPLPHLEKQPAGAVATWNVSLAAGAEWSIGIVMLADAEETGLTATARRLAARFPDTVAAAARAWQQRFDDAFTPGNGRYSGHLPLLETDDPRMRRLYYIAVVSMLALERTSLNPRYRRVYVTAGPRNALTTSYFWDCPTLLWALLDPAEMRNQLKLFLTLDPHSCYAVDFIEERGVGPWYAANDCALFEMFTAYLAVTHDWSLLAEEVAGKTVLTWLEDFALAWRSLRRGGELADYGGPENLLECVPTYIGMVPSFNAANVAMMRSLAELIVERGHDPSRADSLRRQADRLSQAIIEDLYVPGTGYWRCLQADGTAHEVRHCIDFFSAGRYLHHDLAVEVRDEMTEFALKQLVDGSWMHALAPLDPAAAASDRSDHGPRGAFDRWPALTATALHNLCRRDEAIALLRAAEAVTWEGPFGQAHRYRADGPPQLAPEAEYNEVAGSAFADTIIRTLFGYDPDAAGLRPVDPGGRVGQDREFSGALRSVRWGNELLDIILDATGITVVPGTRPAGGAGAASRSGQ